MGRTGRIAISSCGSRSRPATRDCRSSENTASARARLKRQLGPADGGYSTPDGFWRFDTWRIVYGPAAGFARPSSFVNAHSRACLLPWNTIRRSVSVTGPLSAARIPAGTVAVPAWPGLSLPVARVARQENRASVGRWSAEAGPSINVTIGRALKIRSPPLEYEGRVRVGRKALEGPGRAEHLVEVVQVSLPALIRRGVLRQATLVLPLGPPRSPGRRCLNSGFVPPVTHANPQCRESPRPSACHQKGLVAPASRSFDDRA